MSGSSFAKKAMPKISGNEAHKCLVPGITVYRQRDKYRFRYFSLMAVACWLTKTGT